jgi:AhpD family alkylhydroperoxidase
MKADRISPYDAAPTAMKAIQGVEACIHKCGLEHSLIELVKMRASQINGCAFCLDMHSKDARAAGETEQRLYLLNAWRESTLYTARERAALGWTEELTLIADSHVGDDLFEQVGREFSDAEVVNLTTLVGLINAWNRLAISMRYQHG